MERFRQPQSKWQEFVLLFFSRYRWGRRLLGGRWEAFVHDMGTKRYFIVWHWVKKLDTIQTTQGLLGKEEYRALDEG